MTTAGQTNLLLGAILGLILGVGAAFFLEYLDRTLRTSADVEMLLSIPVLGIIPRLRKIPAESEAEDRHSHLPLLVALDPLDPAAEAYRNLRMNLMFMSTEDKPIRTLLISSPGPNEGKSTTSINFAVMLAQQGERVLLVDADIRRPAIHRAMDVLREPGLTDLLIGAVEIREAVRPNVLPNLDVLPSGPFPRNPSELLNSRKMQQLLRDFEGTYNHIILDSSPILAVTDSAILGTHADGLVLVLRSGETEQRAAERAVDQVRRVGVRVFGAVLNEVGSSTVEESYYMQYYYSYHPQQRTGWKKLVHSLHRTSWTRVGRYLQEEDAGLGCQSPLPVLLVLGIDQGGRDAASRQLVFEERPRCPVEVSGRDDVSPVGKGGENRHRDRRHTARKEQPCLRPLESGHLLAYERLIRIVAVPGIEKLGSRLTGPSEKRSALNDRQNNRCSRNGLGRI